jgi:hypothetical protein
LLLKLVATIHDSNKTKTTLMYRGDLPARTTDVILVQGLNQAQLVDSPLIIQQPWQGDLHALHHIAFDTLEVLLCLMLDQVPVQQLACRHLAPHCIGKLEISNLPW